MNCKPICSIKTIEPKKLARKKLSDYIEYNNNLKNCTLNFFGVAVNGFPSADHFSITNNWYSDRQVQLRGKRKTQIKKIAL